MVAGALSYFWKKGSQIKNRKFRYYHEGLDKAEEELIFSAEVLAQQRFEDLAQWLLI